VGIAGGPTKCARAGADFGYDEVIDYRSEDVDARLGELAPRGVDVYFDNVGGELLDVALMHLARGARIVVCGAISQYNQAQPAGPRNYWQLLVKRASMQGFLVFDYAQSYGQARDRMRGWLDSGRLLNAVHIERGDVDAFPELLLGIFGRQHVGKLLLEVVPSE
jgi:NADPH-dependent curcumin reductase CurA